MSIGTPVHGGLAPASDWKVNSVRGLGLNIGDYVRVTGVLALDCGHGLTHPCNEGDASYQNQEMHPVYSIDVVTRGGIELTGTWADNNGRTYYIRQVGNTVWWLGMSPFRDHSFAVVFQGKIHNETKGEPIIYGYWQSVPLGAGEGGGPVTLFMGHGRTSFSADSSSSFAGTQWQKLY